MKTVGMKTILIVILVIAIIAAIHCNNSSGTGPGGVASLIGTWISTALDVQASITTNTDQTAPELFSQGVGVINITGDRQATLTHLARWVWGQDVITIAAEDQRPILDLLPFLYHNGDLIARPISLLAVFNIFGAFVAMPAPADSIPYIEIQGAFPYDNANYRLTANNVQLNEWGGAGTVVADGALASPIVQVPAGTPTSILDVDDAANVDMTLILDENGTFRRDIDFYGNPMTFQGTWTSETDNRITLTYTGMLYDDGVLIQATLDYDIDGNTLTATLVEDFCLFLLFYGEFDTSVEYYAPLEVLLGLDAGSLVNVTLTTEITYTRQ